ncbi:MAG: UDP-N-acetylmuramoyl-L-alanyl-D-glutamate--2,6-diaminopimelate ligase [bacterium]|nr:UDP-N-acetylmuramoyl-L-alanyl-D-glutamate--2,6-diaminopimelate ligase [bacterium]
MAPKDWTLRRLLGAAGLLEHGADLPPDIPIASLTDDSRNVSSGSCFVAISGTRADGRGFIPAAAAAGAVAVVDEGGSGVPAGVVHVRVPDSRSALARLAAVFHGVTQCRNGRRLRLIGITGTNGKTTTCRLLQAILEAAGHRTASVGTLGYGLGSRSVPSRMTTPAPLVLCDQLAHALDAGATYAVMEVSSHALDQHRCDGLSFDAAVFTTLSGDHLDYHGTRAAYVRAKKRLFDVLDADAAAIVNADDPASPEMLPDCRAAVVRYGLTATGTDVNAEVVRSSIEGNLLRLRFAGRTVNLSSRLMGRHNAINIAAAAAAAWKLGVPVGDIVRGIEDTKVVSGRLERVEPDGCPISVLVDYSHTDDALDHALATLVPLTVGRLICVFGCGGDRDRTKRPRMGAVVGRRAHVAVVTSDNPRTEDPRAIINEILPGIEGYEDCSTHVEPDRRQAIKLAVGLAEPGDTVLIAGKGHETYQDLGAEQAHFDDAEEAREAIQAASRQRTWTVGAGAP